MRHVLVEAQLTRALSTVHSTSCCSLSPCAWKGIPHDSQQLKKIVNGDIHAISEDSQPFCLFSTCCFWGVLAQSSILLTLCCFIDTVVHLLVVYPVCAPGDSIHLLCLCGFLVMQKPFGIEIEFSLWWVSTVKTVETIESVSQSESLYCGQPNNADRPTEGWTGELLVKMAAQATTQAEAEAATQGDESAVAVNDARHANGGSSKDQRHFAKNRRRKRSGWNQRMHFFKCPCARYGGLQKEATKDSKKICYWEQKQSKKICCWREKCVFGWMKDS